MTDELDSRSHQTDQNGETWVKVNFRSDGVLAMVNRCVFHPRGFALSYDEESAEFALTGTGLESWNFILGSDEADKLPRSFQQLFAMTGVMNGSGMYVLYDPNNPPPEMKIPQKEDETND